MIERGIDWETIGLTLTRSTLENDLFASPEASSSIVISIKRGKLGCCPASVVSRAQDIIDDRLTRDALHACRYGYVKKQQSQQEATASNGRESHDVEQFGTIPTVTGLKRTNVRGPKEVNEG